MRKLLHKIGMALIIVPMGILMCYPKSTIAATFILLSLGLGWGISVGVDWVLG